MALNQTKVLAQVKESIEGAGFAFGKNIKKDNSRRAFNLGESWSTASFGNVTDKATIKPIEDAYKRTVAHIVIIKQKVPGFSGWTKIYITPPDDTSKGRLLWDSDSWFIQMNGEAILDYIEKENA